MLKKSIFFTSSPAQTRQAGRLLAEELLRTKVDKKARVVGLIGDLGTGKTTLLKGFAKALGTKEKILSPTFLIMRKLPLAGSRAFYHVDCYRIRKPKELLDLGLKEIMADDKNIVVIEWADKVMGLLPKTAIILKFSHLDIKKRKIACSVKAS